MFWLLMSLAAVVDASPLWLLLPLLLLLLLLLLLAAHTVVGVVQMLCHR
jgi:hypothetical protein